MTMMTIVYVRVSTDDQVEHSPEAQRQRCAEYAKLKGFGSIRFLSDEGKSGKNLDRPAMRELIDLIETGQVANLIVWRHDRLTRNSGDTQRLLDLFAKHCVSVHSINEGDLDSTSANGRFISIINGAVSQFEREKTVENVKAFVKDQNQDGYWVNRPPPGYDLIQNVLQPNDDAHLVRRVFSLRFREVFQRGLSQVPGFPGRKPCCPGFAPTP